MKWYKVVVLPLLVLTLTTSQAQETRKYVNDYLNIGADARGIGMSKSVLTSTNDASATYWNPSLIAMSDYNLGLSTMYADLVGGLSNYNFISLTKKLNNESAAIGFTFLRMGTDDIPNTLYLLDENGTPDYNRVSYFSAADYLFQFSFAKKLGDPTDTAGAQKALGVNLKFVNRRAASFAKAWGIGLDLAFTMRRQNSSFAAVVKDATTTITNWDITFTPEQQAILLQTENRIVEKSSEVALPTFLLGYGYRFDINPKFSLGLETNLISSIDGAKNNIINLGNISIDPNVGVEFNYNKKISLRGGIGNFQKQTDAEDSLKRITTMSPSVGAGVQLGRFSIDYAFSKFESTNTAPYSHFISLSARLQKKAKTSAPMLEGNNPTN